MAYSKRVLKGCIGYNSIGWPLIVMERAKSDNPNQPVLCEVFGLEHECGSVYYNDIVLTADQEQWHSEIIRMGFSPSKRYFKGALIQT